MVPTNMSSFLRDENNKNESLQLLSERICQAQITSRLPLTKEEDVISNDNQKSMEAVEPSLREETYTIIGVHAQYGAVK